MESVSSPLDDLAERLRERLLAEAGDGDGPLHERIGALVDREAGLLDAATRADLVGRIGRRCFGLGPLEPLLDDPGVDEIMVNGSGPGHPVFVERAGVLEATGIAFADEAELRHAIERILAPVGRRVDDAEPLADARLPDGSRVNVVIPPLALDGPALTIRRFRRHGLSPEDLVGLGTWPPALRDLLAAAVRARLTILVSGGTGSGKTTTLNALSAFVPAGERIVTIEDTAELRLQQPHVVRLEARPPSVEGRGEVTIRRLVRNALRMRPDRIVVGEVRGAEAPRLGLPPRPCRYTPRPDARYSRRFRAFRRPGRRSAGDSWRSSPLYRRASRTVMAVDRRELQLRANELDDERDLLAQDYGDLFSGVQRMVEVGDRRLDPDGMVAGRLTRLVSLLSAPRVFASQRPAHGVKPRERWVAADASDARHTQSGLDWLAAAATYLMCVPGVGPCTVEQDRMLGEAMTALNRARAEFGRLSSVPSRVSARAR
jgi:pilus assembly protein CpaF